MKLKRYQPCGKMRYETERIAIRAALGSSRRAGIPLRVYRCPSRRGWHLTKRPSWIESRSQASGGLAPAGARARSDDTNAAGHQIRCVCSRCAWLGDPSATSGVTL